MLNKEANPKRKDGKKSMGKYLLFRIDNRLVHGQVCTAWIPEKGIKRAVIIHDEYAQDPFLCDLHEMAVPSGVKCDTITTEEAVKQWKEDQFGEDNTIVIFQTPEHAMKAYEEGIRFERIQVATLAGEKNSVCVYKQVNVSPERAKVFQEMDSKGIQVYCQMFPADAETSMMELLDQPRNKKALGI